MIIPILFIDQKERNGLRPSWPARHIHPNGIGEARPFELEEPDF